MKKILFFGLLVIGLLFLFVDEGAGPIVDQNGISTIALTDQLLSKYDSNADGLLDVANESFLRKDLDGVIKTESRGLLFTDADNFGDGDGSVTKLEMINFLDEFDTDHNGELTTYENIFESILNGKSEWGKFDKKYGERFGYSEK